MKTILMPNLKIYDMQGIFAVIICHYHYYDKTVKVVTLSWRKRGWWDRERSRTRKSQDPNPGCPQHSYTICRSTDHYWRQKCFLTGFFNPTSKFVLTTIFCSSWIRQASTNSGWLLSKDISLTTVSLCKAGAIVYDYIGWRNTLVNLRHYN